MTDPTGATSFAYDDAGRLTQVAAPAGTLSYAYDDAGRRTQMTLPGARSVDYAYGTAGRLASLTDWGGRTTTFAYDPDGRRTSISRANGVDSTYAYDGAGRLTSVSHATTGGPLLEFSYDYDAADNRTSVTTAEGTETYTYDQLDRITAASYPDGTNVAYAYDASGNRTTETRNGTPTEYAYDAAGQLTSAGGTQYAHDESGNLVSAGADSYVWDWDNRLTQSTRDGHTASYAYDGDGVRTAATVDGTPASFLVDRRGGLPTVVEDGDAAYLHADGLIEEVEGSSARFGLADALGSVRGLADGSGSLVGTRSFEVFGDLRATSGLTSPFGFTGEPTDATGLVYLRARSLDPMTGRMLSADTVRPNALGTQGFNLYAYAGNNPATWIDPAGHQAEQVVPQIGPALAALLAIVSGVVAIVREHPLAALVAFALAALIIWCLASGPCSSRTAELGSESADGKTTWTPEELADAATSEPGTPTEPRPNPSPRPFPCLPLPVVDCGVPTDQDESERGEYLYRSGGHTYYNFTPRPEDWPSKENDVTGWPLNGLSAYDSKARVTS